MTSTDALLLAVAIIGAVIVLALPALRDETVLIAVVAFRSLTDVGAASTGSLLPSSLLSLTICLIVLMRSVMPTGGEPRVRQRVVVIPVCALVAFWSLVSFIRWGADASLLSESARVLSILALFILASRTNFERPVLCLSLMVAPSVVISVTGWAAGVPALISDGGRLAGTFSHPNAAAAFFGAASLAFGWLAIKRGNLRLLVPAVMLVGVVLLTQSIGSLAGVAAGGVALAFALGPRVAWLRALLGVAIVAVVVVAFILGPGQQRVDQFQTFDASSALATNTAQDSLGWRLVNWSLLLALWTVHPALGYGLGSTYTFVMPLGAPPHNAFIQVLVELGWVGSLCVLVVGVVWVIAAFRHSTSLGGAVLIAAVYVAALGLESNILGYSAADYLLVAVLPLLALSDRSRTSSRGSGVPNVHRPILAHRRG